VMLVTVTVPSPGTSCAPISPGIRCAAAGELRRLSWQRLPAP
jgi:hypothetical protein